METPTRTVKKIEKFMFIVPNTKWFGKRQWLWFNPAVLSLAPILEKKGFESKILEANIDDLTPEQVKEEIRKYSPDAVGITNMSLEYWKQPHFTAKIVKEVNPNIITIMGGVQATTLPQKIMEDSNFDYVILSEGEERLPQLLNIIQKDNLDFSEMNGVGYRENGKVFIKEPFGFIEDLDSLSLPDYKKFNWQKIMNNTQKATGGIASKQFPSASVLTSRGCPNRCCFCAGPIAMGRKVRYRSPENILKEIDMLVNEYGVREITFMDDAMYGDRERARKILEGIKERNYNLIWKNTSVAYWDLDYDLLKLMKESGCYQVIIAPESGNKRVLKEIIHKAGTKEKAREVVNWCKELNLDVETMFVIGFPGETWEEIRDTTNFADELDPTLVKFAIATPFPRTELFNVAVEKGYLPKDFNFYREDMIGFAKGIIETPDFSPKELSMLRCYEWDRINFKTQEKKEKCARMIGMSVEEVDRFRKMTRETIGINFVDQAKKERKGELEKGEVGQDLEN